MAEFSVIEQLNTIRVEMRDSSTHRGLAVQFFASTRDANELMQIGRDIEDFGAAVQRRAKLMKEAVHGKG